uniref:CWH43-like N-terminal domain-containing protein n=1 Tax=Timema cristinae TaxID=61476 RepID=A0A7R9GYQ3_TIMCR|nr:unnamed protein product [Timema cristinae]
MEGNSVSSKAAVYFLISFRELCLVTLCLPLSSLLICFVTAYIFQQDEIHETHCRVYNVIPSISAITGISPQRYLWRVCVAFHIGPRVVIASVYRTYYRMLLSQLPEAKNANTCRLLDVCYWLNMMEVGALCGVTYVSNRENYPFSWFSMCEYLIASANMAFHVTVMLDFPTEKMVVARGLPELLFNDYSLHWKKTE